MKAVDANVLIYAIDTTDVPRHAQAVSLMQTWSQAAERPILLWQVACEYLSYLRRQQSRKLFTPDRVADEFQRVLNNFRLVLPEYDLLHISRDLYARYSLSHWDSLLLAACISAGIDTLYSEDMSHGMAYDSVTVVNPFRTV